MREWYQHKGLWRNVSPEWEYEQYGFYPEGLSDIIFNTCNKIIEDDDESDWAYDALCICMDLLMDGKRWPNPNPEQAAKTRLEHRWSRLLFRLGKKTVKYRPQHSETRDGYIAWATLCVKLNATELIEDVVPPWYLYTPSFWNWWKYLITGKSKHKFGYVIWEFFGLSAKDYVQRLDKLKRLAVNLIEER